MKREDFLIDLGKTIPLFFPDTVSTDGIRITKNGSQDFCIDIEFFKNSSSIFTMEFYHDSFSDEELEKGMKKITGYLGIDGIINLDTTKMVEKTLNPVHNSTKYYFKIPVSLAQGFTD